MNRRLGRVAAVSALALVASVVRPAYAADTLTITVEPETQAMSGATLTILGDAGPDCVVAGTYEVTLTYTNAEGDEATEVVSGVLPAVSSVFSADLVIPEDARAGAPEDAPASVAATATCDGETATSQTEQIEVLFHEGELTVTPDEVEAGDNVTVSGTECYGGGYEVVVVPAGQDVGDAEVAAADSLPDGTHDFSAELTVVDSAEAGDYEVYAFCPGSIHNVGALTVTAVPGSGGPRPTPSPTATTAPPTAPTAAAPAAPVDAEADFTG